MTTFIPNEPATTSVTTNGMSEHLMAETPTAMESVEKTKERTPLLGRLRSASGGDRCCH